jgi:hypothetical protein
MAGGQPIRLGPFTGGLNLASDPTAIADAELAVCTNFGRDIDGSLISRPPIEELKGHIGWAERIVCLAEAIFSGNHYIIGSNSSGVYHYLNGTWTLITSTFQAMVAIQYADKVYLVAKPGSANPGGKWDPSGGFVAVAAIPKGSAAVKHKERLFIVPGVSATTNTSRLQFSDSGDFETWDPVNFIDISQGDGTNLVDITVFQNNLVLFKTQSTYSLAYDVRPADAVLNEISSTIGVNKQFNMVNYENQVYVFSGGWVYEIINYDFHRLNTKVPFVLDATTPSAFSAENIFLCLLEDRLVCRFYRNTYVYGLRTRTWSQWESESDLLHYFGPIVTIHPSTGNEYYSGSCVTAHTTVLKFLDKSVASSTESGFDTVATIIDTFTRSAIDSWGTSDSGHLWTTAGGVATDFSVDGTQGIQSLGSVASARACSVLGTDILDPDFKVSIATDKLATGASHIIDMMARYIDGNNHYLMQVEFTITQTVRLLIRKLVAGVPTDIVAATTIASLTHAANTFFTARFKIQGTILSGKIWLTSGTEPIAWGVSVTDSALVAAGIIRLRSTLVTGNTNVLPVLVKYDNVNVIDAITTDYTITCTAKTKNFDMAVSHQYKRLWWWGADVTTDNDIIGKATPIVVSFNVTWGDLAAFTWGDLADNTWGQPLSVPSTIETVASTGTGTSRRFAKFLKSLRYRQINFEIILTTEGSLADGPARLFTLTVITETKQAAVKAVS